MASLKSWMAAVRSPWSSGAASAAPVEALPATVADPNRPTFDPSAIVPWLADPRLAAVQEQVGREAYKGAADQLAADGLPVTHHQLDVTDREDIGRLQDFVEETYGRLDILVNNAAVYIDDQHSLLALDYDILQVTMATNAFGPLLLTQTFVPLMRRHNYGRIVNVSSGIGELSDLGSSWPAYRLSKILLNIQTRIIARELRGSNILINAMCPGWVRSRMGGPNATSSVEEGADTAIWLATLPENSIWLRAALFPPDCIRLYRR